MRKFRLAVLVVLILALSMGCGQGGGSSSGGGSSESGSAEPTNRLEEIKARGYIEVIMEPYMIPFEFIDATKSGDEQYVGVDVEIAQYIADKIGVELRIIPLEFGAVLAGISEGKYDLAISALAYTPLRAETMNLSEGYFWGSNEGYGMVVREEDVANYATAEDFEGKTVVVQSGSIQEALLDQYLLEIIAEQKTLSSMTDCYLSVSTEKSDASVIAISNARLYIEANPSSGLAVVEGLKFEVDDEFTGTRAAAPAGEEELIAVVNEAIEELVAEGQIDEWYEEYSEYAKTLGI